MSEVSGAFQANAAGLMRAVELLVAEKTEANSGARGRSELPGTLPESGIGPSATIEELAEPVLGQARHLGAPGFLAHMDPPTPWITWAMQLWNSSTNQNLLHPDTAPVARAIETKVIDWLAPFFSQSGGHMTSGSTIANLTALWAAREAGAHTVVATRHAHLSIAKGAHLLGMHYRPIDRWVAAGNLDGCAAVITAGVTSTGEIEPLDAAPLAAWRHVDAAWAGPLVLSDQNRGLLAGIGQADSVAVSAHKWLFQPKESAMVLFANVEAAHASVSFGADYLSVPNVGVAGSHGAAAVPLLATLLAYGRQGIAGWIDQSMYQVEVLARAVHAAPDLEYRTEPQSGVLNWRHTQVSANELQAQLPADVFVSTTTIEGEPWLRSVGANPMADPLYVVAAVLDAV